MITDVSTAVDTSSFANINASVSLSNSSMRDVSEANTNSKLVSEPSSSVAESWRMTSISDGEEIIHDLPCRRWAASLAARRGRYPLPIVPIAEVSDGWTVVAEKSRVDVFVRGGTDDDIALSVDGTTDGKNALE